MTRGKAKAGSGTPWIVRQRTMLQAAFALLWLSPFLRIHSVCGPVFHCYSCPLAAFSCPIGALANFSALHVFPFIAVGTLLLVGALFGSLVCGYACPFGLFQDLLGKIPTPKFRLPAWTGYTR
ncbi:MAG: 4Fe-4S binding protein, partial [Planctomycetota bacterium]